MGWLDDLFNNNNKPEDIRPVIKMKAINNKNEKQVKKVITICQLLMKGE